MVLRRAFLIYILPLILLTSCNTVDPVTHSLDYSFTVEDVSCTEAWIELSASSILNAEIYRDDSLLCSFYTKQIDTVVCTDGLLPDRSYNFSVKLEHILPNGNKSIITKELTARTLDTTSSNFTWQKFEFGGETGSSTLYDVAIISENNIWAVGEIYKKHSSGQPDPNLYNLLKWDGNEWKMERVYFKNRNGQIFLAPIRAIFAINEQDVILGIDQLIHWNGNNYRSIEIPNSIFHSWINKIWGSSSSDLYTVGNYGNIAHWDGTKWSKIESGTSLDIYDIWGEYNHKLKKCEIVAVASDYDNKELISIDGNVVKKYTLSKKLEKLSTIWFQSDRLYIVAGSGIYQKRLLSDPEWRNNVNDFTNFYTTSIRGNDLNDIFGVGAFGDFLHFNGTNWKADFTEPLLSSGAYTRIAVKEKVFVAVGGNQKGIHSTAVVMIGRR